MGDRCLVPSPSKTTRTLAVWALSCSVVFSFAPQAPVPVHVQRALPRTALSSSTSTDHSSSSSSSSVIAARRALEVATVVVRNLAVPLASSASAAGLGGEWTWNEFWASGGGGGDDGVSNAERVATALEELGPTFVKFGQALSSRPDIVPETLAAALSRLQDDMEPFDDATARRVVLEETTAALGRRRAEALVASLSDGPVAAASVGQVYKGWLDGRGHVAVKVRRPGIEDVVRNDRALLERAASFLESLPAVPGTASANHQSNDDDNGKHNKKSNNGRLINTELVAAVDEFMGRLEEELDYRREKDNAVKFASLYSVGTGTAVDTMPAVDGRRRRNEQRGVVVPEFLTDLCTDNVLVMSWIEGDKLTDVASEAGSHDDERLVRENLELVELATQCTLSQLLVTGTLHADPHRGNLLKVRRDDHDDDDSSRRPEYRLAYLDFGMVSYVPSRVRDALVCAVAHLVFAQDTDAVADLFGELRLVPPDVLHDETERAALRRAMEKTLRESLSWPDRDVSSSSSSAVPVLLFDKLLDNLARMVPRFRFDLPPYFVNNARALSTLEGIARTLDPSFNVLRVMYPTALERLLRNPSRSVVVDDALDRLVRDPDTGLVCRKRIDRLLRDAASLTGHGRRRILWDALRTKGGRRLARSAAREVLDPCARRRRRRRRTRTSTSGRPRRRYLLQL